MEFSVRIPFVELLGFELRRMDGGEAEIAAALGVSVMVAPSIVASPKA